MPPAYGHILGTRLGPPWCGGRANEQARSRTDVSSSWNHFLARGLSLNLSAEHLEKEGGHGSFKVAFPASHRGAGLGDRK